MPEIADTGADAKQLLKRKVGPIPAWGWGIVLVGSTGAFIYIRKRRANGSQGASGDRTIAVQPSDAIGPYTGSGGGSGSTPIIDNGTGSSSAPNFDWTAFALAIRASLDAIVANTVRPPTGTPNVPPTPTPAPPPATTPIPTPSVPVGGNGGSGNQTPIPPTQVPSSASSGILNVPGGAAGIPQSILTNSINTVHLTSGGLRVSDLVGWTAWAPPSNIPAFSGAPADSYSANPGGAYQQWGANEYIPAGSYVVLVKNGAAVPGFQPRAA